jgi:hypothetical protein
MPTESQNILQEFLEVVQPDSSLRNFNLTLPCGAVESCASAHEPRTREVHMTQPASRSFTSGFSTEGSERHTTSFSETQANPTREEIEARAYELYVERGYADGHDQEDWLQAEQELSESRAHHGLAKAKSA